MGLRSKRYRLFVGLITLVLWASADADVLTDFNGNARDLGEFTGDGKWLVVMMWKSNCRISNAVVHEYVDLHAFGSDTDVRVLGISLDGAGNLSDARTFVDRHAIRFPNLIGSYEDMVAMAVYLTGKPWRGTPAFLIYDPEGILRGSEAGYVPADTVLEFIQSSKAASRPSHESGQ